MQDLKERCEEIGKNGGLLHEILIASGEQFLEETRKILAQKPILGINREV